MGFSIIPARWQGKEQKSVYLKSISIQGFKSFPDKINVNFVDGLTAIVGPNGSGKSNICDAIRWVLGEQSTKTLRGSKMEDVIFNGTARRKATGFAEVTLVLDNSTHIIPSSYQEIAVTRRYYRSGESEYYINRKPARLKDIHEMFMDTGLGRDGYSIIGQGRIAEILSLKGEDRRQVFEEAAGITKFRYRKSEAQRKLAAAEENLTRAEDIIQGLEERIGPLKTASEKASKYLNLRDRLREREINLWLHQMEEVAQKKNAAQNDLTVAINTLEMNSSACDKMDYEIDQGYEALRATDVKIEEQKNLLHQQENDLTKRQGEITLRQNTIENNQSHIKRLEVENALAKESESSLAQSLAEAQQEWEACGQELLEMEQELQQQLEKDTQLMAFLDDKNQQIEAINQKLKEDMARRADLRIAYSTKKAQTVSYEERAQTLSQDLQTRRQEQEENNQGLTQAREELAAAQKAIEEQENSLVGHRKLAELKQQEIDRLLAEYQIEDRALYENKSRYKMLRDMERDFEGYGKSVKTVMKEAKQGRLRGIFGPVSSLIKTDSQYVTAIETALGSGAQNIVVEDENCGRDAIRMLQRTGNGRATFLPLTSIQSRDFTWNGVELYDGYIGVADELVRFDPKFRNVVKNLLARTVIMEDMDTAIALAKKYRYAFRIVTLDGQVLNAGGSMTGGSAAKSSHVFSRGAEIEALSQAIGQREETLARLKKQGESARQALEQAQFQLQKAQGAQEEQKQKKMGLEYTIQHLEQKAQELEKTILSLEQEQQAGEKGMEENRALCLQMQEEIAALDETIAGSESLAAEMEGSKAAFTAQREKLNSYIFNRKIDINTKEKDREILEEKMEDMKKQSSRSVEDCARRLEEMAQKEQENKTCQEEICRLEEEMGTIRGRMEQCRRDIGALTNQRMDTEKNINDRQREVKEIRSRLTNLERERARLENIQNNLQLEQDGIINRMWESYELTLTEAEGYRKDLGDFALVKQEATQLKQQIKALGNINLDAMEEYKEVKEKYDFLTAQRDDLLEAREGLEKVIDDLTKNMRIIFGEQFAIINEQFKLTFRELFGGGSGELLLDDPDNVLESGIEIRVQPPGKKVKSLSLLSGGEQAFVAIALLFAILKVRPTPFCIFDEIEAALDDVNVARYASYLKRNGGKTQFIVVTHRRGTMEEADMLYGVTMQEQGVSKLLAINVSEVEEKLHLNAK